jgi:hypothetical protein
VRWNDDDVITHDTLHMRITDLTQPDYQVWPNPIKPIHNRQSACHIWQPENGWTDFIEIWYGRYATADVSKLVRFNILHLELPTWRMLKVVRWDMTPLPTILCACASLTFPNLT